MYVSMIQRTVFVCFPFHHTCQIEQLSRWRCSARHIYSKNTLRSTSSSILDENQIAKFSPRKTIYPENGARKSKERRKEINVLCGFCAGCADNHREPQKICFIRAAAVSWLCKYTIWSSCNRISCVFKLRQRNKWICKHHHCSGYSDYRDRLESASKWKKFQPNSAMRARFSARQWFRTSTTDV